jgi:hypothetical protein
MSIEITLAITEVNYRNNPFGIPIKKGTFNTKFEGVVYQTPRDAILKGIVDPTIKYANLDNENLIHAPIDATHYGNGFVRKFLNQDFADDYDIGKSSV